MPWAFPWTPAIRKSPMWTTIENGAMWPSANSGMPDFVIIGNPPGPGNPRVAHFQAALSALGLSPASLITYADLLAGKVNLEQVRKPNSLVRIESPGREFEVERTLLAVGAEHEDAEGNFERL